MWSIHGNSTFYKVKREIYHYYVNFKQNLALSEIDTLLASIKEVIPEYLKFLYFLASKRWAAQLPTFGHALHFQGAIVIHIFGVLFFVLASNFRVRISRKRSLACQSPCQTKLRFHLRLSSPRLIFNVCCFFIVWI